MSSPDRPSLLPDPAAQPRPLGQRLQLLFAVLILPVVAVTLPALLVTAIFGQRPKPKAPPVHATPTPRPAAHAPPAPSPDTSGLTAALNHSAESFLPAPAPLTVEPVRLSVRADHVAVRAEKVAGQAKILGGSTIEGVSAPGEKHLFVDLPAGCADAFRQAVTKNEPPVAPIATSEPTLPATNWKSSFAPPPTMSDPAPGIVTFALLDESRLFVKILGGNVSTSHRGPAPSLPTYVVQSGERSLAIVHTGVGDTPPGRGRLQDLVGSGSGPAWVISAGYAGGLSPDLRVGDLLLGRNRSDPGLLNAARLLLENERPHVGTLVTYDAALETVADKAALHAATDALAVDMETAWIADVCAAAGVPLLSLRVVSDAADQPFPVPGRILFDTARQRPRPLALSLWLLAHPADIPGFAAFVRGLSPARARLTRALGRLITHL